MNEHQHRPEDEDGMTIPFTGENMAKLATIARIAERQGWDVLAWMADHGGPWLEAHPDGTAAEMIAALRDTIPPPLAARLKPEYR